MINKFKESILGFKAKKDSKQIQKFIDAFQLEYLTPEEIDFYTTNMEDDRLRLMIMKCLSFSKDFNHTILLRCSRVDFNILCAMVAKRFINDGENLIGELLLSNRTGNIVNYNIEDVIDIISKKYVEGLSSEAENVMNMVLTQIRPSVFSSCMNTRKLVMFNSDIHGDEVVLQPRDVISGLVSIILGGSK